MSRCQMLAQPPRAPPQPSYRSGRNFRCKEKTDMIPPLSRAVIRAAFPREISPLHTAQGNSSGRNFSERA
jgi:hypothetical protein